MWTFCFLQAKIISLVPDFIDVKIYVKFFNTLISLVWILAFIFQRNGSLMVAGREVWVVGSFKQFCKQIKKHYFCTNVNYVLHVFIIRLNLCANSGSQISVVTIIIIFNLRTAAFKAHCVISVRRSNFRHQTSPRVSPRDSTQRRKMELWARNVL
jgi:hypothetical protein